MEQAIYAAALWIVLDVSFVRFAGIVVGAVRAIGNVRRAVSARLGPTELLNMPEPIVLLLVTIYLMRHRPATPPTASLSVACAAVGVTIALVALGLTFWAFVSLPTVSVGHYVRDDQPVVASGVYAWLRHPIYAGVIMMWFSLGLAFQNATVLWIALLYVVPSYLLYIRAEEKMMRESYGAAYADYCRKVGGLFPRLSGSPARVT